MPFWQQVACAAASFEFSLKAATLSGSLLPGTSILGFALKKDMGLNDTTRCSTGILLVEIQFFDAWKWDLNLHRPVFGTRNVGSA